MLSQEKHEKYVVITEKVRNFSLFEEKLSFFCQQQQKDQKAPLHFLKLWWTQ